MLPVLRLVGDRQEHALSKIRQRLTNELGLTEEELAARLASDTTTVFLNRVGWAVQYLKIGGRDSSSAPGRLRNHRPRVVTSESATFRNHRKDSSSVPGVHAIRGEEFRT